MRANLRAFRRLSAADGLTLPGMGTYGAPKFRAFGSNSGGGGGGQLAAATTTWMAVMAGRVAGKASKKAAKKAVSQRAREAPARSGDDEAARRKSPPGDQDSGELQAECTRLRADLKSAKSRIEMLEGRQAEVLNRIDWAIDSLQNAIDDEN